MEATKEFRQKWRVLRNAIRVPDKNAKNPHFKSSYRSWEDTEKALRDANVDSHFVTINNDTQAGVEWWVEIEGEEVKVNTCLVDKAKRDPQATGGCFSYALRYCVATYLGWGMPEEDDDGNNATGIEVDTSFDPVALDAELAAAKQPVNPEPVPVEKSAVTPTQEADLIIGAINLQVTVQGVKEFWANHADELNHMMQQDQQQYERVIQAWKARGYQLQTEESKNEPAKTEA